MRKSCSRLTALESGNRIPRNSPMLEEITAEKKSPSEPRSRALRSRRDPSRPRRALLRRPDPVAGRLLPRHAPAHLRARCSSSPSGRPRSTSSRSKRSSTAPEPSRRRAASSYLTALLDGVPDVGNVEHYARIVKEKSTLRRLIRAGQRIVRDGRVGGAGRRGPAWRGHRRDLRHRRRGRARRVRGDRARSSATTSTSSRRPGAGRACCRAWRRASTELDRMTSGLQLTDLIVVAARPVGGKDLVRPEHRPARRHPRGPVGRFLLAGNVQGADRLPRSLLRGRRRRQEGPRRLRLEGGHAAPRPGPVQDLRRRASSSTTARP